MAGFQSGVSNNERFAIFLLISRKQLKNRQMLRIMPEPGLQHGENLVHGGLLHILNIHIISVGNSHLKFWNFWKGGQNLRPAYKKNRFTKY
jgi:hypothetical protein